MPIFIADELVKHHPNPIPNHQPVSDEVVDPSPVTSDETFKFELVQNNADEMKINYSEYVDLSELAKDSYYNKQWDSVNDIKRDPESSIVILKPPFVSEMNQALKEDPIFQCLNVKENYFM